MVALASKRVLIACPDLRNVNLRWAAATFAALDQGNQPVLAPFAEDLDWSDTRAVEAFLLATKPQLIISALPQGKLLQTLLADPISKEYLHSMLQAVADYAAQAEIPLLHLSNYHVFGGEAKTAYAETDEAAPLGEWGEQVLQLEKIVGERVTRHIILRTSWLIDTQGENLFTQIMHTLTEGGELTLNRHLRGSPTWSDDLVRILCGVVRQILSGAENWGVFHYCSSDATNQWEFGQELQTSFTELHSLRGKLLLNEERPETNAALGANHIEPLSANLTCRRLRNNFGVHARSWRQGLAANIKQWLVLQQEKNSAATSLSKSG